MKTFLKKLRARFSRTHHPAHHTPLVIVDISSFQSKNVHGGIPGLIKTMKTFSAQEKVPMKGVLTGPHPPFDMTPQLDFSILTAANDTDLTRCIVDILRRDGRKGTVVVSSHPDILSLSERCGIDTMSPSTLIKGFKYTADRNHRRHPSPHEQKAHPSHARSPARGNSPGNNRKSENNERDNSILDLIDPL